MKFQARIHGVQIPDEERYMDADQMKNYFDGLVQKTNG